MSVRTIVYVTMSLDVGGTEKHLSLIAPRLRERGWKPVIFCLWRRGELAPMLELSGIEVIGRTATGRPGRKWSADTPYILVSWLKLIALVLQRHPPIVHFFLPLAYMLGAPVAILSRVPVKIMSRRSLNLYQSGNLTVQRIERWLHARMSAVLGNSRRVVQELIDREGCAPKKVGLIYNGTDLSTIAAAQRPDTSALDIPEGQFTIIMVANLIAYKGHADLLEALAQIAPDLHQPWHLICVGRDDGCGPQLREQAERLGLSGNIHFLGERKDVPQLLKAADIGVLCSHQEGFSNAVIEGLGAGLPLIVTDVGGNAEAITDGETGHVVPAHDPSALGTAILQLATDAAARSRMAAAARERAERHFSIESCVDKYDRLYRALLDRKDVDQVEGVSLAQH